MLRIVESFSLVTHRASQVETLFDVLEEIDPKLKALGVVETNGIMTYIAAYAKKTSRIGM